MQLSFFITQVLVLFQVTKSLEPAFSIQSGIIGKDIWNTDQMSQSFKWIPLICIGT